MPRSYWNDGQEIVEGDLRNATARLEIELYDRILYEMLNRQQNFFFGDSLIASYINATTSQVKLGNGAYYDNTQVDPEPKTRLLSVLANTNVTHAAADPSNPRIDIIVATAARATLLSQNRNFKDAGTGVVSSVSMVVETDWISTLTVVAGTPGVSPAVPATPAGTIKLAEVAVAAATGIAGAGSYTDKRARWKRGGENRKAITSTTTMDFDDGTVECNAVGGAFAYNLLPAAQWPGKSVALVKTDSSANAVTVTANGAELINGAATFALDAQYFMQSFYSDGTSIYVK